MGPDRVSITGGGSGRFLLGARLFEHSHDVALFHDKIFDPVELDLRAGPFPEQHAVTDLEVDRDELTGLVAASRAHGDDLALLRFLLSGVGDDDAAGGFFLGIDALDDDAIVKRTKTHAFLLQGSAERSPPVAKND